MPQDNANDALARIEAALAGQGERLDALTVALDTLTTAMTRRFDTVDRRLRSMDERLTLVEEKIDRLSGVRFDADRLLTGFARLKERVDALEAGEGP